MPNIVADFSFEYLLNRYEDDELISKKKINK